MLNISNSKELYSILKSVDSSLTMRDAAFAILHIVTGSAYLAYIMAITEDISPKSGRPRLMSNRPEIIKLEEIIKERYLSPDEEGPEQEAQSEKEAQEDKSPPYFAPIDLDSISEEDLNSELMQKLIFAELKNLCNIRETKSNSLTAKEYADLTARITDITLKLNKLKGDEPIDNARVIVYHKYNDICPYCHHEIAVDRRTEEEKQKDDERYEKLFGIQGGD